jgi:hypothetical protein
MPAKASRPTATKRTAFTPKPARPLAGRIHHLHRSLVDQINAGHLTNGIKTCQKILSLLSSGTEVPDEIKIDINGESITSSKQEIKTNALQTLLFLLLQTDQYDLALETIESASQSDKLDFEKAYCLYRLHEEEKARELVEKLRATEGGSVGLEQESARRLAHLEAQVVSIGDSFGLSHIEWSPLCRVIEREIMPRPRRSTMSSCPPRYVSRHSDTTAADIPLYRMQTSNRISSPTWTPPQRTSNSRKQAMQTSSETRLALSPSRPLKHLHRLSPSLRHLLRLRFKLARRRPRM